MPFASLAREKPHNRSEKIMNKTDSNLSEWFLEFEQKKQRLPNTPKLSDILLAPEIGIDEDIL